MVWYWEAQTRLFPIFLAILDYRLSRAWIERVIDCLALSPADLVKAIAENRRTISGSFMRLDSPTLSANPIKNSEEPH